jgi:hypothetical protein
MAYRVYRGNPAKKISGAAEKCAAARGTGTEGQQEAEEEEVTGTKDSEIVKKHFGNELLFMLYEFGHEMHYEPDSWEKVFEFSKYTKVKNMFMRLARARVKEAQDGGR